MMPSSIEHASFQRVDSSLFSSDLALEGINTFDNFEYEELLSGSERGKRAIPSLQAWLIGLYKKPNLRENNFSERDRPVLVVGPQINDTVVGGSLESSITTIISHYYEKPQLLTFEELNFLMKIFVEEKNESILTNLLTLAKQYEEQGYLLHAICCYVVVIDINNSLRKMDIQRLNAQTISCCQNFAKTLQNDSLLYVFVESNLVQAVEFLLKNRAIFNLDIDGLIFYKRDPALSVACEHGHMSIVNLLLAGGADITAHSHRKTCLYVASKNGQEAIVERLLLHPRVKEIIDLRCKADNTGDTALHAAIIEGHLFIARKLIDAGANITLRNNFGVPGNTILTQLVIFSEKCKDTQAQDDFACFLGKSVKNFAQDFNDWLLEKAIENGLYRFFSTQCISYVNNLNILKLIEIGCRILGKRIEITNEKVRGCKNILTFILSNAKSLGIDEPKVLEKFESFRGNVLFYILRKGQIDIAQHILVNCPNSLNQMFEGSHALHSAAENEIDNKEIVELILNKTPDLINIPSNYHGLAALHLSAQCGNVEVTKFLLEQDASPNVRAINPDKDTPLTLVAKACSGFISEERVKRFIKVCEVLVEFGADIALRDDKGETALKIQENAREGGHQGLIRLFSVNHLNAPSKEPKKRPLGSESFSKKKARGNLNSHSSSSELNRIYDYESQKSQKQLEAKAKSEQQLEILNSLENYSIEQPQSPSRSKFSLQQIGTSNTNVSGNIFYGPSTVEHNSSIYHISFNRKNNLQELSLEELRQGLVEYYENEHWHLKRLFDNKKVPVENNYITLSIITSEEHQKKQKQFGDIDTAKAPNADKMLPSCEDLFVHKEPIALSDLFKKQLDENEVFNRLIVSGRAGIGKSILCQYLSIRWQQELVGNPEKFLAFNQFQDVKLESEKEELKWLKGFKMVFWIRLREIPTLFKEVKDVSLQSVINFSCYNGQKDLESLKNALKRYQQESLFILDGYDEIEDFLNKDKPIYNPSLLIAWNILKDQKNVILTSRPRNLDFLWPKDKTVRKLDLMGFSNEQIKKYVKNFMAETRSQQGYSSNDLLNYLESSPSIWGTAHVPINLEMFCWLYREKKLSRRANNLSMLYEEVIEGVMHEMPKKHQEINRWPDAVILSKQAKKLSIKDVAINFLECLAYQSMIRNELLLSGETIKLSSAKTLVAHEIKYEKCLTEKLLEVCCQFGFLFSSGQGGTSIAEQTHYFVHLSFQEHFAARYVASCLTKDLKESKEVYENILRQIQTDKHHPRYQLMWWLTSGLLANKGKYKDKNEFLKEFSHYSFLSFLSQNYTTQEDFTLAVHCLDECVGADKDILSKIFSSGDSEYKNLKEKMECYFSYFVFYPESILRQDTLETLERCSNFLLMKPFIDELFFQRLIVFMKKESAKFYELDESINDDDSFKIYEIMQECEILLKIPERANESAAELVKLARQGSIEYYQKIQIWEILLKVPKFSNQVIKGLIELTEEGTGGWGTGTQTWEVLLKVPDYIDKAASGLIAWTERQVDLKSKEKEIETRKEIELYDTLESWGICKGIERWEAIESWEILLKTPGYKEKAAEKLIILAKEKKLDFLHRRRALKILLKTPGYTNQAVEQLIVLSQDKDIKSSQKISVLKTLLKISGQHANFVTTELVTLAEDTSLEIYKRIKVLHLLLKTSDYTDYAASQLMASVMPLAKNKNVGFWSVKFLGIETIHILESLLRIEKYTDRVVIGLTELAKDKSVEIPPRMEALDILLKIPRHIDYAVRQLILLIQGDNIEFFKSERFLEILLEMPDYANQVATKINTFAQGKIIETRLRMIAWKILLKLPEYSFEISRDLVVFAKDKSIDVRKRIQTWEIFLEIFESNDPIASQLMISGGDKSINTKKRMKAWRTFLNILSRDSQAEEELILLSKNENLDEQQRTEIVTAFLKIPLFVKEIVEELIVLAGITDENSMFKQIKNEAVWKILLKIPRFTIYAAEQLIVLAEDKSIHNYEKIKLLNILIKMPIYTNQALEKLIFLVENNSMDADERQKIWQILLKFPQYKDKAKTELITLAQNGNFPDGSFIGGGKIQIWEFLLKIPEYAGEAVEELFALAKDKDAKAYQRTRALEILLKIPSHASRAVEELITLTTNESFNYGKIIHAWELLLEAAEYADRGTAELIKLSVDKKLEPYERYQALEALLKTSSRVGQVILWAKNNPNFNERRQLEKRLLASSQNFEHAEEVLTALMPNKNELLEDSDNEYAVLTSRDHLIFSELENTLAQTGTEDSCLKERFNIYDTVDPEREQKEVQDQRRRASVQPPSQQIHQAHLRQAQPNQRQSPQQPEQKTDAYSETSTIRELMHISSILQSENIYRAMENPACTLSASHGYPIANEGPVILHRLQNAVGGWLLEEQHNEAFIPGRPKFENFLRGNKLQATQVSGGRLNCYIYSLLQHTTGQYHKRAFDAPLIDKIKQHAGVNLKPEMVDPSTEEAVNIIKAINELYGVNLVVYTFQINRDGKPGITDTIFDQENAGEQQPVFLWLQPGHFVAITSIKLYNSALKNNRFQEQRNQESDFWEPEGFQEQEDERSDFWGLDELYTRSAPLEVFTIQLSIQEQMQLEWVSFSQGQQLSREEVRYWENLKLQQERLCTKFSGLEQREVSSEQYNLLLQKLQQLNEKQEQINTNVSRSSLSSDALKKSVLLRAEYVRESVESLKPDPTPKGKRGKRDEEKALQEPSKSSSSSSKLRTNLTSSPTLPPISVSDVGITLTSKEIQVIMMEIGINVQNQEKVAAKISYALSIANIDKDNIRKKVNQAFKNLKLNFEPSEELQLKNGIITNLSLKMQSVQTKSLRVKDSGGLDKDEGGGPSSGAGSCALSGVAGARGSSSGSNKQDPKVGESPASSSNRLFSGNNREREQAGEELTAVMEISHQGTNLSSLPPVSQMAPISPSVKPGTSTVTSKTTFKQVDTDSTALVVPLVYLQTSHANVCSQTSAVPAEKKQPRVFRARPRPVPRTNTGDSL